MPKSLFQPDTITQIPRWIAAGLSKADIAARIGCTEGTLIVVCSKLHISLRRPKRSIRFALRSGEMVTMTLILPASIAAALAARAGDLGKDSHSLVVDMVSSIVQGDLFEVVLGCDNKTSG